jgi:hypothetical protein
MLTTSVYEPHVMTETLVVFGVVGLLVLLGTLAVSVSVEVLVLSGAACMALGLALGVPAGLLYHLKLYRYLAKRGKVSRSFLWHPTRYHAALEPEELRRVMPSFITGALCFGLILLGSVIFMLGFVRT